LVILPALKTIDESQIIRAGKNIKDISILRADSLNILDLLTHQYLVMSKGGIETIKKVYRREATKVKQS
jgi:ribosomal protein L4